MNGLAMVIIDASMPGLGWCVNVKAEPGLPNGSMSIFFTTRQVGAYSLLHCTVGLRTLQSSTLDLILSSIQNDHISSGQQVHRRWTKYNAVDKDRFPCTMRRSAFSDEILILTKRVREYKHSDGRAVNEVIAKSYCTYPTRLRM